jgi:hypothetical protein
VATAAESLQATLSETEYGALMVLAQSSVALSGRKVAGALKVSPTTANAALSTLFQAGFATSESVGKATLWRLAVSHPMITTWLEEQSLGDQDPAGSSPYSTGGGGTRLEHSYAACLVAALLTGGFVPELGDAIALESIRLQASDVSDADDIVLEGRDANRNLHRSSIAVRRSPALTTSDSDSVPLFRDFLAIVTEQWPEVSAGRWRLVLAVSTNANAIAQLSELAALARSLPSEGEFGKRLTQTGRTNAQVRARFNHILALVTKASEGLASANGLTAEELTWRLLSALSIRSLRLERTERADRTTAVNALQGTLRDSTPGSADQLFSRLEELVGMWAPQAAVLTQAVVRRSLSEFALEPSPPFAQAWEMLDRLGLRLRDQIRPGLRLDAAQSLELERSAERVRLLDAMRSAGAAAGTLVITGDPDVGKSALALRVAETMKVEGAAVSCLSLRDLPHNVIELEAQLGGFAVDDIMAAGAVGPVRLLLVDGAEAVLEGKGSTFRLVAVAALRAGFGVAAVTRADGSRQVTQQLMSASELVESRVAPDEHVVAPLTDAERGTLVEEVHALRRFGDDPRASWLLGRPGLVDALLRTGDPLDPAHLLCEADVFSAVWRSVIRRAEVHEPGSASPDDREQAALNVARHALGVAADPPHGTATAELRSDGILRVPTNPATATGDEFTTDLFRDFALCRLLIAQGWDSLSAAGGPRWSIRAARLACETALLDPDGSAAWARLQAAFSEIAAADGDRWLEVPYEALLTVGHAETVIGSLWASLTDGDGSSLATLLRLAEARYVQGTVGDAFALAPLVKVAFCDQPELDQQRRTGRRSIKEVIHALVLAWLRGMARSCPTEDPLRQRVRDVILQGLPPSYDDFTVEALACLGPDLDERAQAWLREAAHSRPGDLGSAIESPWVAISMSQANPRLLVELAEAYYIELPHPDRRWGGSGLHDDGIRDLGHGRGGSFGMPQAAWYYGPFYRMLNTAPVEAIGFINRMLDHAATYRVRALSSYGGEPDDTQGVQLALPSTGERLFVGDSHVWAWYRGTSVGPYACMSALLALERFVDHLLESLQISAETIVELLLRDCHNLAVPGLLVGFLTRHPDATGALLDPFLSSPSVWHLETARVTGDYGFRVRDADADKLTGADLRRHTFHETVGTMVVNARIAGNDDRLNQLQAVGATLMDVARAAVAGSDADSQDYLAMIESWAAEFRIENYRMSRSGDQILVQFERPERIEQVLAPRNAELQLTNVLYGLQNRYGSHNDDPACWPVDTLDEDLTAALSIDQGEVIPDGMPWPENALVAVAAAAVRAHALGLATVDPAHLSWAVEAILWAAENPRLDGMSYHGSMFAMGADRAAAAAVPLLCLKPFDSLDLDRSRIDSALRALATSVFDEVRAIYVTGCAPLWAARCQHDESASTCRRHNAAWQAATEGLVDCKLGPWNNQTQQREPDVLPAPFHESLATINDEDIMLNRLRMPVAIMIDASKVPCLGQAIGALWSPLWDAHRRGLARWWAEGYDHHAHISHAPIAKRMIEVALDGDREPIRAHIEHLSSNDKALHSLFDGFATAFTYEDNLRAALAEFWPWALEVALDAIGDGATVRSGNHWYDYMTAALLPTPSPRSWDTDIDATLSRCRQNWLPPEALNALAGRWLELAHREPKAVDAVIKFAKGAPRVWQTTVALDWIEAIIDGRYDLMANHLWYLDEWLLELRNDAQLSGTIRGRYNRIVDGLSAAGDRTAVRLQQLDE